MYELTIYRSDGKVLRSKPVSGCRIRTIEHDPTCPDIRPEGITCVVADGWDDKHGLSVAPKESGSWLTLSHISPDGEVLGVLFDSRRDREYAT